MAAGLGEAAPARQLTQRGFCCIPRLQLEVLFHGVAYILTVSILSGEGAETMSIEVEQKSDASRWRGDFTSRCEATGPVHYPGCTCMHAAAVPRASFAPVLATSHFAACRY